MLGQIATLSCFGVFWLVLFRCICVTCHCRECVKFTGRSFVYTFLTIGGLFLLALTGIFIGEQLGFDVTEYRRAIDGGIHEL